MEFTPKFYDEGWESGWDDMKIYGPTARHTRRFIFQLLSSISFNSILDAGCGTGILLSQIQQKYPHIHPTGSEYSSHGLEFAKKRLPDAEFYVLDLSRENLAKQFDLITCIDVLEHIPDDGAALKNLLAMTAGYLVLSVPLGPLFSVEAERMGHVHGYSRAELNEKIKKAGFDIIKTIQWGFPFYNLHRRIVNRLPAATSGGEFGSRKKLISNLLYGLFYLNLSPGGERYYALCCPSGK